MDTGCPKHVDKNSVGVLFCFVFRVEKYKKRKEKSYLLPPPLRPFPFLRFTRLLS